MELYPFERVAVIHENVRLTDRAVARALAYGKSVSFVVLRKISYAIGLFLVYAFLPHEALSVLFNCIEWLTAIEQ